MFGELWDPFSLGLLFLFSSSAFVPYKCMCITLGFRAIGYYSRLQWVYNRIYLVVWPDIRLENETSIGWIHLVRSFKSLALVEIPDFCRLCELVHSVLVCQFMYSWTILQSGSPTFLSQPPPPSLKATIFVSALVCPVVRVCNNHFGAYSSH